MREQSQALGRFTWEREVLSSDLRSTVRLVGLVAATFANADGSSIHPGLSGLITGSGLSRQSVVKALGELRTLGWLTRTDNGNRRGRADVYQLTRGRQCDGVKEVDSFTGEVVSVVDSITGELVYVVDSITGEVVKEVDPTQPISGVGVNLATDGVNLVDQGGLRVRPHQTSTNPLPVSVAEKPVSSSFIRPSEIQTAADEKEDGEVVAEEIAPRRNAWARAREADLA